MARLRLQQEVWGPVTERFLDRVGLAAGWTVLDVGCGPGLVTERFSERVGARGRVDALDPSPVWHEVLASKFEHAKNVRPLRGSVESAPIEDGAYDLVFARWVVQFLKDPGGVVRRLARALKPGGVLAIEDYDHEGISLFPESEGFRAVVRATRALVAKGGGDSFVAGRLPRLMRAAGLAVPDPVANVICGGPDSPAFRWADSFFAPHSENMVRAGVLTEAERERFLAEWAERKADPDSMFFSPIVADVAGTKPRR